jgi:hypothetical protein
METLTTTSPSAPIVHRTTWSSVLTGSFVAIGVGLFLSAIGLAIGFSVLTGSLSGATAWLAVWSLIVPIIALFIGGAVGAASGPVTSRTHAAITGFATWGFSYLIGGTFAVLGLGAYGLIGPSFGRVGRLFHGIANGTLMNVDQSAVYVWFFCASMLLALCGSIVGASLGLGREVVALERRPIVTRREVTT